MGIGDCQLSTQACVLSDAATPGKLGGLRLINTGEKEKETNPKVGFLLWEEAHAWSVWLTALVLLSP